ncbi:MAG: hypothetical protein L0191_06170 [Acidobacteria bacterium]|nr:hypothetical protein [Acidobacteriota bacterium]
MGLSRATAGLRLLLCFLVCATSAVLASNTAFILRIHRRRYWSRDGTTRDLGDYIESFYNYCEWRRT